MKKQLLSLLTIVIALGCSSADESTAVDFQMTNENTCASEVNLETQWIQDLIQTMECGKYSCKVSLLSSRYIGETVFYTNITDPVCNYQAQLTLYNCSGEIIKKMSNEESIEYLNDLYLEELEGKDGKIELYSCND